MQEKLEALEGPSAVAVILRWVEGLETNRCSVDSGDSYVRGTILMGKHDGQMTSRFFCDAHMQENAECIRNNATAAREQPP